MKELNKKWDAILHKVQQVLEQNSTLKQEVRSLSSQIEQLKAEQKVLNEEKETLYNQINVLKLAKGVGLSDGERAEVKKQIRHYINEIDDCLARMNV